MISYRKVIERLTDSSRSYEERTYIMLSIIGVTAMVIALVFDIFPQPVKSQKKQDPSNKIRYNIDGCTIELQIDVYQCKQKTESNINQALL